MSTTARALIEESARISGVLASGETLSGNDVNDAFKAFIRMVDRWSIDGFLQYELKPDSYSVAANAVTFEVDKDHPIISKVTYIGDFPNQELPLRVLTVDEWASVTDKTLVGLPRAVFYNNNDDGAAIFNIWPIPQSNITVRIWRRAGFTTPATLDQNIDIPFTMMDALVFDLACMLCIQFGRPISQDLRDERDRAKADVKRSNIKITKMANDFQTGYGGNWLDTTAIYTGDDT